MTDTAALIDALEKCRDRFREYEDSHAAKGTLDGDVKARRNAEMVDMCDAALAAVRTPDPDDRLDHILATAIFGSENTARLQEHPEELEHYLGRANSLRHHMQVLGIDVAAIAAMPGG